MKIDAEALRAQYNISDVIGRRTQLRKAGRILVGLCPFHGEKSPSFYVYDATGGYHCYGCGANGDIISFVMLTERLGFREACEMIAGGDLPVVSEAERVKAREEDAAARQASIDGAQDLWDRSVPIAGTPAEVYLLSRRITVRPARFRYAMACAWTDAVTGECGPDMPTLVCGVSDVNDDFIGLQRIFLAPGGKGKANLRNPKLSMGRPAGGSIRLTRGLRDAESHVTVVEGPEDGASVWQVLAERDAVWVACGTSMMPQIRFPGWVRRVTIGADNNKAGRAAAQAAYAAYQDAGLEVRTVYPDAAFGDWNDQLRGIRK